MYDCIIIGGGITGLYSALKLSKKNKVLILDERNYWGGRINTKTRPQYEIGAARFNNNHNILLKLINRYNLTPVLLPENIDFIYKKKELLFNSMFIKNVHIKLDKYFKNIIEKSKLKSKKYLQSITLFDFMNTCNERNISELIVSMFGYYSEIKKMNAYDALKCFESDFVSNRYYILKEGLSYLCKNIVTEISKNGVICKNKIKVKNVVKKDNYFIVSGNNEMWTGKKVIFAIKGHQLLNFEILKPIHNYTKSVYPSELFRIYARYPITNKGVWFKSLNRTTTNSFLRQIIPINYKTGLIMISYTDGNDISVYKNKNGELLNEQQIKNKIQKELKELFPNKNIPMPIYFKTHYWNVGAHHWKPGYNSTYISKKILNPLKNIYICGESFSQKQAWIEGGLETVNELMKII